MGVFHLPFANAGTPRWRYAMPTMARVRPWEEQPTAAGTNPLLAVARALPEFFMENAVVQIEADVRKHPTYVAEQRTGGSQSIVGFAVVERKGSKVAELLWMAVHPEQQRKGVGTALLSALENDLRADGFELLVVKTLAAEARYAPYEGTRQFYEGEGFLLVEAIDPYPGWEPGNPCAIYAKVL